MPFVEIASISEVLTHSRYLLNLRSAEGNVRSLLLFRLATGVQVPAAKSIAATRKRDGDVKVDNAELDIDKIQDQLYAMESTCPHLGADLSHADLEECDDGVVAVCPWHRYDFDLKSGKSQSGLKACTYKVEIRRRAEDNSNINATSVWVETPDFDSNWTLVDWKPVSEDFADAALPDIASLSVGGRDINQAQNNIIPENPPNTLIEWAVLILNTADPAMKVLRTRHAVNLLLSGNLASIGSDESAPRPPDMPPRDERMKTVDPGHAARRKSRVAMLHALANIEQWAIDLAWDAIARFGPSHPSLPPQFFSDFAKIALDESKHFSLLCSRLVALGSYYGSLPVHAGLWQSAVETKDSLKARLAIINLVHEARGLDVNPVTIEKFRRQGDADSVKSLNVIHHDEVTHVTVGHRWFTYICKEEQIDPVQTFREEVRRHFTGALKGPFNEADRLKAGMTPEFYQNLVGEASKYQEAN